MLQTAELLSCVLLRRTSHAPDPSKCITLSPPGSAGIPLQEFAVLGRFLAGRAGPKGAGGAGSSRRQLGDVAPAEAETRQTLNWISLPRAPRHRAP